MTDPAVTPDAAALAQQAECILAMRAEGERRVRMYRHTRSVRLVQQMTNRDRAAELRRLGNWDLAQEFEEAPTPAAIEANHLHSELRWKQTVAGYERQHLHDNAVCKQFRSTLLRIAHDTTMTEQELRDLAREVAG